jgi:hypothetical protein
MPYHSCINSRDAGLSHDGAGVGTAVVGISGGHRLAYPGFFVFVCFFSLCNNDNQHPILELVLSQSDRAFDVQVMMVKSPDVMEVERFTRGQRSNPL